MSGRKLAFFDLDHTLLPFDTQVLFAQFVMEREAWRRIFLLWFVPCLLPAALGWINLRMMKRIFFSFLVGMPGSRLKELAAEFAEDVVANACYPELIERIEELRGEGYFLILNSASPEFYVREIARVLGFDAGVGTRLVVGETMPLVPRIDGDNNKREAKIVAMKERRLIPADYDLDLYGPIPESWAFSDSSADLPLLGIAEWGVTIHPGTRLGREAAKRGWSCLVPPQPYRGKWEEKMATVLLALGLAPWFLQIGAGPED